jgi:hypothetical protein
MTLAFIVRAEFDGRCWTLTVQDLATGERRCSNTFSSGSGGFWRAAEGHVPALRRDRPQPRDPDGTEGS